MKHFLVLSVALLCTIFSKAQWTEWSTLGNGLEVSFKFGKTENDYSHIRFKNVSLTEFCDGRIAFDAFRSGKTDHVGFNSGRIAPQQVIEKGGWWFNCNGSVSNLVLESLSDMNCHDLLHSKTPSSGGVSEIGYDKKESAQEQLKKEEEEKLERLKKKKEEKEEEERKQAALKDKLADQKEESERKQAAQQQKNLERMSNLSSTTPTTPEQKEIAALQQKYERKAELQKTITTAIAQSAAIIYTTLANEKEERRRRSIE